ncbi:MAG: hypothetical protein Q4E18_02770 [Clostridia bacterium]|nr:hypothetical protein [Clostridia bacterium]
MAKYYRQAEELRIEKRNYELWLQGRYIYEAIGALSPILQAFAKKGTKAEPYMARPYALTAKALEREESAKEKAMMEKGKMYMAAVMATDTN